MGAREAEQKVHGQQYNAKAKNTCILKGQTKRPKMKSTKYGSRHGSQNNEEEEKEKVFVAFRCQAVMSLLKVVSHYQPRALDNHNIALRECLSHFYMLVETTGSNGCFQGEGIVLIRDKLFLAVHGVICGEGINWCKQNV